MTYIELLIIAIGLAMDSFAVSLCKGLSMKKVFFKTTLVIGLYFGFFQAGFTIIGYFLGSTFESFISSIDHWIAFILLGIIGGNMIKESFDQESDNIDDKINFATMAPLGIATSIDALTVGITYSFFSMDRIFAFSSIFLASFILCPIGVYLGNFFGLKFRQKAEFAGGLLLILLGLKILLEHLGILG